WADTERAERHQIARLGAGGDVMAVGTGGEVADHAGARQVVPIAAITKVGLAEDRAGGDASVGAELPAARVNARRAVAEAQAGLAVVRGDSDDGHRKTEFGADRAASAAHRERRILRGFADVAGEIIANREERQARRGAAAAVDVRAGRQGAPELARRFDPEARRRLQGQRRGKLPRDILRDDREALRGQVKAVAIEQIAV